MKDILLVILCLLHAVHSSYTLEDCSNTSAAISVNYDNYQITVFDSFQEALDFVKSNNNSQPTICLPPGTHIVSNQIQFGQKSLRLIGSENTTVRCDYDPLPSNEGIDYTWHLNRSEFFCLSGIHFSSCPYPYRVIAVKEVTVRNCTFMNFTEAVFDLFNCETVQLEHSSFTNNSGTGILFETFRGNTGAVALGYTNYPTCLKQPRVSILTVILSVIALMVQPSFRHRSEQLHQAYLLAEVVHWVYSLVQQAAVQF
ncbi:uncharacterized protein LOC135344383 [Halichondria panicea]|uniref:uncharacterized protein LOC135344383 n=1 Tax=Halichondria panicea TaxID=6063 RepID=UPI00312B5DD1